MLRLKQRQVSLWESALPQEILALPEELAEVDRWLNDDRFLEPYRQRFATKVGRPTVPVETYIRLMYLKVRYQLGYETLVQEVSDSISWRRFCFIPLDAKVPHPTTLVKLTLKYGTETLTESNFVLIQKARERKLVRGRKLQLDTTVVTADVHYPTDASLLADANRVIERRVRKLKSAGGAIRTKFRNRNRSIKKKIFGITRVLRKRTGQARDEVRKITGQIADTVYETVVQGHKVLTNVKHKIWRIQNDKSLRPLAVKLREDLDLAERLIKQSEMATQKEYIPDRVISVFDREARPIPRGKHNTDTEFGYKVLLTESENKLITDYEVLKGNPSDDTLLKPAVTRHQQRFGKAPGAVATDRGFSSKSNEEFLLSIGVQRVSLPKKGKKTADRTQHEQQPWFRRLQRWRAGGEATISLLKRKYGLGRSRFRGQSRVTCWVGLSIFTYNLTRVVRLSG